MLYRELDDLKMIVANCFDQLSKSLGRQIEIVKQEATQMQKIAMQADQAAASFGSKQRGINDASQLSLLMSPKSVGATPQLDLESIEVLTKIQKATQDANELMR